MRPTGGAPHAEIKAGDSIIAQRSCGETMTASLYLYVDNATQVRARLPLGATATWSLATDMFWGDRIPLKDPFSNH